jgi:hypothetical protein
MQYERCCRLASAVLMALPVLAHLASRLGVELLESIAPWKCSISVHTFNVPSAAPRVPGESRRDTLTDAMLYGGEPRQLHYPSLPPSLIQHDMPQPMSRVTPAAIASLIGSTPHAHSILIP